MEVKVEKKWSKKELKVNSQKKVDRGTMLVKAGSSAR